MDQTFQTGSITPTNRFLFQEWMPEAIKEIEEHCNRILEIEKECPNSDLAKRNAILARYFLIILNRHREGK